MTLMNFLIILYGWNCKPLLSSWSAKSKLNKSSNPSQWLQFTVATCITQGEIANNVDVVWIDYDATLVKNLTVTLVMRKIASWSCTLSFFRGVDPLELQTVTNYNTFFFNIGIRFYKPKAFQWSAESVYTCYASPGWKPGRIWSRWRRKFLKREKIERQGRILSALKVEI